MRNLSEVERSRLKLFTANSIAVSLIEPTENGLKKSIMDATASVRNYLLENKVHNYLEQSQGPENKVVIKSLLYSDHSTAESKTSLYRPNTKKGDPRIWFSGLTKYSNPNDILALLWYDSNIHVVNLTRLDLESLVNSSILNPLKELFEEINQLENRTSEELLRMMRLLVKKGPTPSLLKADTSVGRTLETALGIDINSSKLPDYKGIELKAFRKGKGNRKNLFAQVPDWDISNMKRSSEILDGFGYSRGEDFKLYCTVSAIVSNSQGLSLKLDHDVRQLIEYADLSEKVDVVAWRLEKLHSRLLEKHKETFWVSAKVVEISGKDHFIYDKVEHTRKPIISQFDLLLEQGIITVDHLIKKNAKGRVAEKGPLFKIKPNSLDLLFPPSQIHNLI